jgi:hypothetical protein
MPTVLVLLGMRFYYWAREHEPVHVQGNINRYVFFPSKQGKPVGRMPNYRHLFF